MIARIGCAAPPRTQAPWTMRHDQPDKSTKYDRELVACLEYRPLRLDLVAPRADDRCIDDPAKLLSYDDALAVIARLIDVARSRGERLRSPIVLVGGTALAAWQIRAYSRDVDIYM